MNESIIKPALVGSIYVLASPLLPSLLSVIGSVVLIVYFVTMLKINAVDKKYHGSWFLYLKSWCQFKKKKEK